MMRSDEAGVDRIAMEEKRKKKANRDPMLSFSRSIGEARALTSQALYSIFLMTEKTSKVSLLSPGRGLMEILIYYREGQLYRAHLGPH